MSDSIRVILGLDGSVAVDVELPPGERCDAIAEGLPAILALLGVPLESIIETGDRPQQPNGVPDGLPLRVGGG